MILERGKEREREVSKKFYMKKSCHISLKFSVLYCIGMKEETLCGLCTPIEN